MSGSPPRYFFFFFYRGLLSFIVLFYSSPSLPVPIDSTVAVNFFRSQRDVLLNLLRHCLPTIAGKLYAKFLSPQDVHDDALNRNLKSSERVTAVLDCIEARIKFVGADFKAIIDIFNSESFLQSPTKEIIRKFCEFLVANGYASLIPMDHY